MNCEPGDLAMTFGAPQDNGLLVEVAEPDVLPPDLDAERWGPFWNVTSLGSPFHVEPGVYAKTVLWPDRLLKPLRDPGDDAKDEMLRPLPCEVVA